jgi:hypothetical protein
MTDTERRLETIKAVWDELPDVVAVKLDDYGRVVEVQFAPPKPAVGVHQFSYTAGDPNQYHGHTT